MITDTTIILDFDGTCVKHEYPNIGDDIGAIPILKKLIKHKNRLVLFTMRSDRKGKRQHLTEAVNWFKENDIPLYGIQTNPSQIEWTDSPKAYGHLIIDDNCLGIPLIKDSNASVFVDWKEIDKMLFE